MELKPIEIVVNKKIKLPKPAKPIKIKKLTTILVPKSNQGINSKDLLQRLNYLYQISNFLVNSNAINPNNKVKKVQKDLKEKDKEVEEINNLISTQPQPIKDSSPNSFNIPEDLNFEDTEFSDLPPDLLNKPLIPVKLKMEKKKKKSNMPIKPTSVSSGQLPISKSLTKLMKDVAKKGTIRMDPTIKRTICKKCNTLLIPGISCKVRVKPSGPHAHLIIKTCFTCKTSLSLPAPPHLSEFEESHLEEVQEEEAEKEDKMEVDEKKEEPRELSKREKRENRQARKPTFFERKDHVTIAGLEEIVYKDIF